MICEIDRFDDRSSSVRSVAQKVYEVVYFTIAGKFNGDFFPFTVFAVDLVDGSANELIQEANCRLGNVVSVRYDIVNLAHVMQIFDEPDIQSVCHFHIKLFVSSQRLQCNHLTHEFDVFGRDRLCEQIAFVAQFV